VQRLVGEFREKESEEVARNCGGEAGKESKRDGNAKSAIEKTSISAVCTFR
jgi:hypothetical protein